MSSAKVIPARGMRDFLPAEKRERERVIDVIRRSYQENGFEEIETPVMEDADRLYSDLGGDNGKMAFAVMRRRLKDSDLRSAEKPMDLVDLGLRFDLTLPLARFLASNSTQLTPTFRSIQIAPVWRAERPQRGRFRQFMQCDIDVAGEAGIIAEMELLSATSDTLQKLGLSGAYARVNDRRILTAALEYSNVPEEDWARTLIAVDRLDKVGVDGVVTELETLGVDGQALMGVLMGFQDGVVPDGINSSIFDDVKELLSSPVGIKMQFDPTLVRGMGYYTGLIFEIGYPGLPYSIGGGGRYDGMVGKFLGRNVPAVGISLGFERLVDLVSLPEEEPQRLLALLVKDDVLPADLIRLKNELKLRGLRTSIQQQTRNVKALLNTLGEAGVTDFAFVKPGDTADSLAIKAILST